MEIQIGGRKIGGGHPCYIIAEISCNHEGDLQEAERIVKAAAECGVDAVKLQTYRADTLTGNFRFKPKETMWSEVDLFELYEKAHTPWDWYGSLNDLAMGLGLTLFSSPFDESAVDFLVEQGAPALKIASFEAVDLKLLEKVASTKLPVLMSTGMTDFLELDEAVRTLYKHSVSQLGLLHCNSGYPASFDEVNLRTIEALKAIFRVPVGLSDHILFPDEELVNPLPHISPVEGVRMGADILELHLTLDRDKGRKLHEQQEGGFDWAFSRTPSELKKIVQMIRKFEADGLESFVDDREKACAARVRGTVCLEPTERELKSRTIRPSLWVTRFIRAGERFRFCPADEDGNFDSLRPAGGLSIRYTDLLAESKAACDLQPGTPLSWEHVALQGETQ